MSKISVIVPVYNVEKYISKCLDSILAQTYAPDAKRILEDMSDKIVGYDGNDLYETAKECEFGLIKKNSEWALDEKLLSGVKAFFNMF